MRQGMFYGSAVALVTPFRNGELDEIALADLIEWQLAERTDAIVILGTTGEPSTLTRAERRRIIACAADHCLGKVPLVVGTGSNDTKTACAYAREAQDMGADMVLSVTPYYNKATQEGAIRHFRAVADAVSIPVILYNVPSRTGMNLLPETVAELAKHPNIRGVKEANTNLEHLLELMRMVGDGFAVYAGEDASTYVLMALGAKGVISASANVIPGLMREITNRFLRGEMELACQAQMRALPVIRALMREVNPISVKTALAAMGRIDEEFRLPLCPLPHKKRTALLNELRAHQIL